MHTTAEPDDSDSPPLSQSQESSQPENLSPIVGYPISSGSEDDENKKGISDSSDTDQETANFLGEVNKGLSGVFHTDLHAANTPTSSATIKRLRKRRHRQSKGNKEREENSACKRPRTAENTPTPPPSDDLELESLVLTQSCPGFKTASGKDVIISEAALKRVKGIFADIENTPDALPQKICNAAGSSVKSTTPLRRPFVKSTTPTPPPSNDLELDLLALTQSCPGFKTASGKDVIISEAALKQVQGLFADIEKTPDALPQKICNVAGSSVKSTPKRPLVSTPIQKKPPTFSRPSTKFKPPTMKRPTTPTPIYPSSKKQASSTPSHNPAEIGMTQDLDEAVAALLADEEAEGFDA